MHRAKTIMGEDNFNCCCGHAVHCEKGVALSPHRPDGIKWLFFLVTCQYGLSKAGVMSSNWCIAGGGGCDFTMHTYTVCLLKLVCEHLSCHIFYDESYFYFYMQWYLQTHVCWKICSSVYIWKCKIISNCVHWYYWIWKSECVQNALQLFAVWVYYD